MYTTHSQIHTHKSSRCVKCAHRRPYAADPRSAVLQALQPRACSRAVVAEARHTRAMWHQKHNQSVEFREQHVNTRSTTTGGERVRTPRADVASNTVGRRVTMRGNNKPPLTPQPRLRSSMTEHSSSRSSSSALFNAMIDHSSLLPQTTRPASATALQSRENTAARAFTCAKTCFTSYAATQYRRIWCHRDDARRIDGTRAAKTTTRATRDTLRTTPNRRLPSVVRTCRWLGRKSRQGRTPSRQRDKADR